MPELPEIETTKNGISPHCQQQLIVKVIIRNYNLRWQIPHDFPKLCKNRTVVRIDRRAKYLLLYLDKGAIIIHLGMSGSLRITDNSIPVKKHDHVDFVFKNDSVLRYHDPRRFGSIHWCDADPLQHRLLVNLGVEPLAKEFNAAYLVKAAAGRTIAVKKFIMDQKMAVGVGNIYASESLFMAKISPLRIASQVSLQEFGLLVKAIKKVLKKAIKMGGTTLRDFVNSDGKPGYFSQKLLVYDRDGENCVVCDNIIIKQQLGQRSSFYCPHCQK